MVAITVILAAVIAAFVFGMAGQITKTKTVAVTVQRISNTQLSFTNMGGQDVAGLTSIAITNGTSTVSTPLGEHVGDTVTVGAAPAREHVIATGTFDDGTQQVLLDTSI